MRTAGILAAVALSFTALHAHADVRAWNAAKAGLPADAQIVVGVDVAAIQQTQLFSALFPKLREKAEVAAMLDALKDSCKVDPLTAVQSLVVAMPVDQSDGAVYLSIAGIDRNKLGECLKTASEHDKGGAKLTIKQTGNLTEMTKDKETTFLGWVGKDVIVVAFHASDKPSLLKWMGGKGALGKSGVGKALGKVNTQATVWGVIDGDKELQPGITAKRAYGAISFAKGKLDADLHAVLASAADATAVADKANQQIAELSKAGGSGGGPPQIVAMLKSVKVTTANDEVVVKASVAEQDLLAVMAMAMAGGGGGGSNP
jgi:hypothetical protein